MTSPLFTPAGAHLASASDINIPKTPLSQRLLDLLQSETLGRAAVYGGSMQHLLPPQLNSITVFDYVQRAKALPLLAIQSLSKKHVAFANPHDLTAADLRALNFTKHGFSPRNRKALAETVSLFEHMMLIAYEAKPRPLSFTLSGYTASDFIAYIYQDIAERFVHTPAVQSPVFTREKAEEIKQWLQAPIPRKQNTPQRHIRRRLMTMLNRNNYQVVSLYKDREVTPELLILFKKLLERDDNEGYTEGALRDFRLVRQDLNRLATHLTLGLYYDLGDTDKIDEFLRIRCPSEVVEFSEENIDKPRSTKTQMRQQRLKTTPTKKQATAMAPSQAIES